MDKIYLDKSISNKVKPPLEDTDLMNFISWFDYSYPQFAHLMIHVMNESVMPVQGRVKAKRKGVRKGVHDLIFIKKMGQYSGLTIEAKRATEKHSSPISDEQEMYGVEFSEEGFYTTAAYGLEQMKKSVKEYLQIK